MDNDICDGVKILCERMETNPEDFWYDGKFHTFGKEIDDYLADPVGPKSRMHIFNDVEREMLVVSYKKLCRTFYTRKVIETLVTEPEKEKLKGARKRNADLRAALLDDLNSAFDKEYNHMTDTYRYVAKGRYNFDENPWT